MFCNLPQILSNPWLGARQHDPLDEAAVIIAERQQAHQANTIHEVVKSKLWRELTTPPAQPAAMQAAPPVVTASPVQQQREQNPLPAFDDPDAKYRDEYAANRAAFQAVGLSVPDYVATRRIDDGLDPLMPTVAAEAPSPVANPLAGNGERFGVGSPHFVIDSEVDAILERGFRRA